MLDISLENDIFVTDPFTKFIQEIDVIFNTSLTSVLGQVKFGSDFERFLWMMTDQSQEISDYAKKLILDNCPTNTLFEWTLGCRKIYDDDGESFYYMVILVQSPNGKNYEHRSYILHDFGASFDKQVIKSINK